MFRPFAMRLCHWMLLIIVSLGLFLPNLGAPTLWDIDEGNNAEAAREMLESGNWVIPTFNFQLRLDKPALLYWLQVAAYKTLGVNEFAARLPSALAALAAVLAVYELGRRLFGATTGLIAGLVLASTASFCVSAHFANPDALLNLFTVLAMFFFWVGYRRGGNLWLVPYGLCTGLATLAKGPVGFVLPLLVLGLFLLWTGEMRRLLTIRCLWGGLVFGLVVAPWYSLVGVETKASWLRGFLMIHNVGRYLSPMENHSGPIWYYVLILLAGFAPWSVFLGLTGWSTVRDIRTSDRGFRRGPQNAEQKFLLSWIMAYFLFFSFSGTKLPNYILPLFPPLALLTGRFLEQWRAGALEPPAWMLRVSLLCLGAIGIATAAGLLIAGGTIPLSGVGGRSMPGLGAWAFLGLAPALGAAAAWWWRRRAGVAVSACASVAILFLGALAAWGAASLNSSKAPQPLAEAFRAAQHEREIRVAAYQYFQPSLVFYCRREVRQLQQEAQALEFLRCPLAVYLFLPASAWEQLEGKVAGPHRLLGRQRDLYRNCEIVVVTNRLE